jgi:methylase of polypeptide subunit release factors
VHTSGPVSLRAAQGGKVFQDREESEFYAQCVRDFLFRHSYELLENKEVVELGVGTGETIVELLKYHDFNAKIRGYEIHAESCERAQRLVEDNGVADRYIVANADFFEAVAHLELGGCAISNPPYLPAEDDDILMPGLWGGGDGSAVTKRILECGFECLIMLVSSFSNPLSTIDYAAEQGYRVLDYVVRTMRFGPYSSESRVRQRIEQLGQEGSAFVSADRYCLAGVAWVRSADGADLTDALKRAVTSLTPCR